MDASGEHTAKKARAPTATATATTTTVAKQEAGEVEVEVEAEAMERQEPPPPPQINARVEASFLHCTACLLPLKPPVFKCDAAGHAVCCRCHGYHHCRICDRAAVYRHSSDLDGIVSAVTVPCVYEGFGCSSYVAYHEAADHQRQCPHAPCSCPDPGCGFAASPATLLGHFAAAHSWPVAEVRYGKPHKLTVPLPAPAPAPSQRWQVLVGAEDRCLFLVSLGALGPATAVSLVCVRANAAAATPRYRCKVWAEVPRSADNLALLSSMVGISDLSCGLVAAEQGMFLTVPPDLVHEVSGETLLLLNVRIDKPRNQL